MSPSIEQRIRKIQVSGLMISRGKDKIRKSVSREKTILQNNEKLLNEKKKKTERGKSYTYLK